MSQERINEESDIWLSRLNAGDDRAFEFLWERFFRRMVAVARQRIPPSHRSIRDEEDIALSAFNSFCLRFRAGNFFASQSIDSIWPLLVKITINKSNDHLRKNLRQKRDASRNIQTQQQDLESLMIEDDHNGLELAANEIVNSLIDAIQKTGDDDLLAIVLSTLQGEQPSDIAKRMECSVRTIQRKLKTIHRIWESMIE